MLCSRGRVVRQVRDDKRLLQEIQKHRTYVKLNWNTFLLFTSMYAI